MGNLSIIDKNENIIGSDSRVNIHKRGLLHREVHVWIFNDRGEIIFQKRSKNAETFPNLLDASVGGHVEIGDNYLTAAIKELEEETGIKAKDNELIFITKMRRRGVDKITGKINNTIKNIYAYRFNGEAKELKLEDNWAISLEFWPIDKILNLNIKEKKAFITSIIDDEYQNIFRKIKELHL